MGRRCVLEVQIAGSANNFAGFTDVHAVPKTIHVFTAIMYETSKSSTIMPSWPMLHRVENPRWQPTNYLRNYEIYYQTSNCEPTAFNHVKLAEKNVLRRFQ